MWDYPRPPRLDIVDRRVQVWCNATLIADTLRPRRVLETSHPPTYYISPDDIYTAALEPSGGRGSYCEWKGEATYYDVVTTNERTARAAWTYFDPTPPFQALAGWVAFYPALLRCVVDGVDVEPQPGTFYGGWVTPDVVGPFKGEPGSQGW